MVGGTNYCFVFFYVFSFSVQVSTVLFLLSGKQFPSDGLIEPLNIGILMRCFNVFLELIGINE